MNAEFGGWGGVGESTQPKRHSDINNVDVSMQLHVNSFRSMSVYIISSGDVDLTEAKGGYQAN